MYSFFPPPVWMQSTRYNELFPATNNEHIHSSYKEHSL